MLNRIAESLYWRSRNLERADDTARTLDITVRHMPAADEGATEEMQWTPLLTIVEADERYLARHPDGQVTVQRVIRFLTQDTDNRGSLYNSLRIARENARVVRDRISRRWRACHGDIMRFRVVRSAEIRFDGPLREARGTPAKFALVLTALARSWGLPAGLASGYHAEPPHGYGATGLHHWAEVRVPGMGWRGFDPSRGRGTDAGYIRIGVGRGNRDLQDLRQCWQGAAAPLPMLGGLHIEART